MIIYDISVKIPYTPVYPGDPQTKLKQVGTIKACGYNLTEISMCAHAGTHVDAPLHFIDGAESIEALEPDLFCGKATVKTIYKKSGQIEEEDLKGMKIQRGERLIFKTRNSIDGHIKDRDFYKDFCSLTPSAAQYLVKHDVRLVGIDYASIGSGDTNAQTHLILLKAGTAVLEWLDLGAVEDGEYFLSAAPLKITGSEGAPARALLIDFKK
jgi:arylformamidase